MTSANTSLSGLVLADLLMRCEERKITHLLVKCEVCNRPFGTDCMRVRLVCNECSTPVDVVILALKSPVYMPVGKRSYVTIDRTTEISHINAGQLYDLSKMTRRNPIFVNYTQPLRHLPRTTQLVLIKTVPAHKNHYALVTLKRLTQFLGLKATMRSGQIVKLAEY